MIFIVAAIAFLSLALLGLAILGGLFLSMRDLEEHERSPQLRDRSKQQDGGGIQR